MWLSPKRWPGTKPIWPSAAHDVMLSGRRSTPAKGRAIQMTLILALNCSLRADLSSDAAAHSATGQALQRLLAALEA
jgi:hypothetical protein